MRLRRLALAALAVAVVGPAACTDDGPGEGGARLEVDGRAMVERADGAEEVVEGTTDLASGDRVEVAAGQAVLALRDGTRLELRAARADSASSLLRMGEVPVLEAGDALVSAPEVARIMAAGTLVEVKEGAAQVSRSLGLAVAAYDAEVGVDSAGQQRVVPSLRQMVVPALGRPPQAPRPLSYDSADPWDRRFLGSAVQLGETLTSLAEGYTNNLTPGLGGTPEFFKQVLPGLDDEPAFGPTLIDVQRPPGETLVGAAITDLGTQGSFEDRWRSVFGFRSEGALWGLVVLDQQVSGPPLLGTVQQAVSMSPLGFAPPPVVVPPPDDEPLRPTTTTTTAPTSPPDAEPPATTTTTAPPPPPDEQLRPPIDAGLDPVVEVVGGLVNGLLGILARV